MGNLYKFTSSAKFSTASEEGNPTLGWLDFVLTDNKPNENKQGIPVAAFAGLVSSGLNMPIKVARGEVKAGHDGAEPLGPITSLISDDSQVIGKAAIWKEWRPEDYEMLKKMSEDGIGIDISWELRYSESTIDEEKVEWLTNPMVLAATIVGAPAYGGRTPVISVASETNAANEDDDPAGDKELKALKKTVAELKTEVAVLTEYKESREKEDSDALLLEARLALLTEAGYEYTEDEVSEKVAVWLKMSDEAFATMVDMLKKTKSVSASTSSPIPDLSGSGSTSLIAIVRAGLKELKSSSEEN